MHDTEQPNKMKLFCIPYAGGSATIYWQWNRFIHDSIQLCPIEMAARGGRFTDPFYDSIDEATNDLLKQIVSKFDGSPYAIYGHSMGGLLVYELVHLLKARGYKEPEHIFISGRQPPHVPDNIAFHLIDDKNHFMNMIFKYGGFTEKDAENKELVEFVLPIMKQDFKLLSTYNHRPKAEKFECNLTVMNGRKDEDAKKAHIDQWASYTNKNCEFYNFDGGHFFIKENAEEVVEVINQTIGEAV